MLSTRALGAAAPRSAISGVLVGVWPPAARAASQQPKIGPASRLQPAKRCVQQRPVVMIVPFVPGALPHGHCQGAAADYRPSDTSCNGADQQDADLAEENTISPLQHGAGLSLDSLDCRGYRFSAADAKRGDANLAAAMLQGT